MKSEQPKSPESFEQPKDNSISWEEYSKREAKPFTEQRIEKPIPPKSPYDDSSISWEKYSKDWQKFKEEQRKWIREVEKPMSARGALQLLESVGPAGEGWTNEVYIYTPSGRYLTDRNLEFSELKHLLEDLLESNLQFHLLSAPKSISPEKENE